MARKSASGLKARALWFTAPRTATLREEVVAPQGPGEVSVRATVAAVSHGDVIKAVIAAVLGLSIEAHARFEISPASVSKLEFWPGGARLLCMNEATAE